MKPTNQVAKKLNLSAKSSQSQKPGPALSAVGASRAGEAELDDLVSKLDKKFEELAGNMARIMEYTPEAFKADKDGIRTSSRKTRKETDEILRGIRTLAKCNKTLKRLEQVKAGYSIMRARRERRCEVKPRVKKQSAPPANAERGVASAAMAAPAPGLKIDTAEIAHEFKVMCIRECAPANASVDSPDQAAEYWRRNIPSANWFDPAKECLIVLVLNTRRRPIGHNLVTLGTLDTCLIHPREVFRPVIVAAGSAIFLMHNHPSGDPTPSEGDINGTREMIRAGQLLKIEVLDHVVMGSKSPDQIRDYVSLRGLGIFMSSGYVQLKARK